MPRGKPISFLSQVSNTHDYSSGVNRQYKLRNQSITQVESQSTNGYKFRVKKREDYYKIRNDLADYLTNFINMIRVSLLDYRL